MASPRFNCGEFKPGERRIRWPPRTSNLGGGGGGGSRCGKRGGGPCIGGPPIIIPPYTVEWTCVCDSLCDSQTYTACENASSRECVRIWETQGRKHGRVYKSEAACKASGFGEAPCYICGWKCVTGTKDCPNSPPVISRKCEECSPKKFQFDCAFKHLSDCVQSPCEDDECGRGGPSDPGWRCEYSSGGGVPECKKCTGSESDCAYASLELCKEGCKPHKFACLTQFESKCIASKKEAAKNQGCYECDSKGGLSNATQKQFVLDVQSAYAFHGCDEKNPATCDNGTTVALGWPAQITESLKDVNCQYDDSDCDGRCINYDNPCTGSARGGPGFSSAIKGNFRSVRTINLEVEAEKSNVSTSGLYHEDFNIFSHEPRNELNLVANDKYLDIFNSEITEEIYYVMDVVELAASGWKEFPFYQVTQESLEASIRVDVLSLFDSFTSIEGGQIDRINFLGMIYRLLMSGRLNEFELDYYNDLANTQNRNESIIYEYNESKDLAQRAALGIIVDEALSIDPAQHEYTDNLLFKRLRFLNEDINAVIPIDLAATPTSSIELQNDGIGIIVDNSGIAEVDSSDRVAVPLGEGGGYYFEITKDDGTKIPLETSSAVSSTYFIGRNTREEVLDLFEAENGFLLSVSAKDGQSEFDTNFTSSVTHVKPRVFKLSLSSVEDEESEDPLIARTYGRYELLADADVAAWVRDHGASITQVNVDFRDPFFNYAIESEKVDIRLNDVSFKSFVSDPTNYTYDRLARSIPFGIILVPGQGSRHLPFGTFSELKDFETDVVRRLSVSPSIYAEDTDAQTIPLDMSAVGDHLGVYYVGLLEKEDPNTEAVMFTFDDSSELYKDTYYIDGVYSSSPSGSIPRPAMGQVVRLIEDTLKARYNLNGLTWWDIFRRLTADQVSKLFLEGTDEFYTSLTKGDWRGVAIRNVLSKDPSDETGILSVKDDSITDTIVLEQNHRRNPTSFPNNYSYITGPTGGGGY